MDILDLVNGSRQYLYQITMVLSVSIEPEGKQDCLILCNVIKRNRCVLYSNGVVKAGGFTVVANFF